MSLQTRISDLSTRIGTEFKAVRTEIAAGGGGDLLASNNLSELTNDATARTNLDVDSSGEVDAKVAAIDVTSLGALAIASNLSDLNNVITARTNLSVDSSAEVDAKVAAVTTTTLGGLAVANNLSDVANVITARTNLGVYSTTDADAAIAAATAALVDGAPATLDTLNELAAALNDDASQITTILTALGNRLQFDAAQTLSGVEQTQGQTNLGVVSATAIGDTDANFVTTFEAALL
jgi:hypothetical protein